VVEWLTGSGVANEMTARGLGEKSSVAPNQEADGSDDPEGRQKNRRVQITVNTE
jgi:outer membrane protein OmpA-like peptidoglycan-associated protein